MPEPESSLSMSRLGERVDVRHLLPVDRGHLVELLRALAPEDWRRPTPCPGWDVHDLVAHVVQDHVRRISGDRDGFAGAAFDAGETLSDFLARTNDEFVRAMRQASPALLIDLLGHLGSELDALWADVDPAAPATLDVSWSGAVNTAAWLDMAREYTELWVHQQQVRQATQRPGADDVGLMGAVVDIFARALPFTLRACRRPPGTTFKLTVTGESGGVWTALSDGHDWSIVPDRGEPDASWRVDAVSFWQLGCREISPVEARGRGSGEGDPELVAAASELLAVVA